MEVYFVEKDSLCSEEITNQPLYIQYPELYEEIYIKSEIDEEIKRLKKEKENAYNDGWNDASANYEQSLKEEWMGDKVPIETYNMICKDLDKANKKIDQLTKLTVKQDKMLGEANIKIKQLKKKRGVLWKGEEKCRCGNLLQCMLFNKHSILVMVRNHKRINLDDKEI
jgi:hypothetical protein